MYSFLWLQQKIKNLGVLKPEIYCLIVLDARITNSKKSKILGVSLGIFWLADAPLQPHAAFSLCLAIFFPWLMFELPLFGGHQSYWNRAHQNDLILT